MRIAVKEYLDGKLSGGNFMGKMSGAEADLSWYPDFSLADPREPKV